MSLTAYPLGSGSNQGRPSRDQGYLHGATGTPPDDARQGQGDDRKLPDTSV
jgi:hypothetical protein